MSHGAGVVMEGGRWGEEEGWGGGGRRRGGGGEMGEVGGRVAFA